MLYTANTDISSVRVVLAEAAQKPDWGISSLDVATAFLNAPMPEGEEESVYVKPPALLEQFKLIKSGTYWSLNRAIYGLKISPRLWGVKNEIYSYENEVSNERKEAEGNSIIDRCCTMDLGG